MQFEHAWWFIAQRQLVHLLELGAALQRQQRGRVGGSVGGVGDGKGVEDRVILKGGGRDVAEEEVEAEGEEEEEEEEAGQGEKEEY